MGMADRSPPLLDFAAHDISHSPSPAAIENPRILRDCGGKLRVYDPRSPANIPSVQAPGKRLAGILIPAFSPRREADLGIGDTLALREWIDWAAEHQVGFIQLLPINENGLEESPYSAISSVALDPIYLAFEVAEIPGLTEADLTKAREQLKAAVQSPLVNYPAVRGVKRKLLELVWSRFNNAAPVLLEEFAQFRKLEAEWLEDYTVFRFLMEIHGEALTWDHWPEASRTPRSARSFLEKLRKRDNAGVERRLGFFAFIQWLCFRQWLALRDHAELRGVKLALARRDAQ